MSKFWQGLKCDTFWVSMTVFIEEQQKDSVTPTVALATSSVLAGSAGTLTGPARGRGQGEKGGRFAGEWSEAGLYQARKITRDRS